MQITPATSCTHGFVAVPEGGGAMFVAVPAGELPGLSFEAFEDIKPPNIDYRKSRATPLSRTGP